MTSPKECPFEITWMALPPNAPTHALSIKADVDGFSGERCYVIRVPGYILKLYEKPKDKAPEKA